MTVTFTEVENDPNPRLERAEGEECLATWWHQATPGTTYWRCLVPARHLPGQTLPFRHDDLVEGPDGNPRLHRQKGDVAIWQFMGDAMRSQIAFGMRDLHGTRTFMELDDNYLRPAPYLKGQVHSPWKETHKEAQASGTGYSHEMHRMITPLFEGLIVSTDFLANEYEDWNDNIHVCPNSIDPADWEYERPEPDGVFRIVYYGSISHLQDAPIVTKALKWAARQPGVEVWTAGFEVPSWSFPYQVAPWKPRLDEARAELFRFDLGIAPLKGNRWSRGKSDIKALEYIMAGVCPLVSNEVPYRTLQHIPDLVLDDGDWEAAIRYFVKNPDLAARRAAEAKDWVLEERTIDKTIHLWREALA